MIAVQGKPQAKDDPVSPDAVVLPNAFLGSYAALARRLQGQAVGAKLPAYIAPQGEISISVTAVAPERIETPKGVVNVTRFGLVFANPPPAGNLIVNLWADPECRSAPLQHSGAGTRDGARGHRLGGVAHRGVLSAWRRARDDSGGRLQPRGNVTRPTRPAAPLPAVILIGGSGPTDRDETVAGIPIFGDIARDLVDAGFVVVRYDKRGVGQSGGRAESATIADYAEDARARPAVAREAEGRRQGTHRRWSATAKARWSRMLRRPRARQGRRHRAHRRAVNDGATVVSNSRSAAVEDADRRCAAAEKVALQEKINQAVIKGTGWNDIPEAVRRVADTPWFYSFLTFNPAKAMKETRAPVLIVQGELDTQVQPYHADKLAEFARARKHKAAVEVVKVPGVNHLLVPAKTGDVSEYGTLGPEAQVSTQMTSAIAGFSRKRFPHRVDALAEFGRAVVVVGGLGDTIGAPSPPRRGDGSTAPRAAS